MAAEMKTWSTETLASWLEGNGFAEFAPACREKQIDGLLLSNMTQEEIAAEMGVTSLTAKKLQLHLQEEARKAAPAVAKAAPVAAAPPPAATRAAPAPMMMPPRRRGGVVRGAAVGAATGAAKGAVAGAILPGVDTKDAAAAGAAVGAMSGGGRGLKNRMLRR